MKVALGLKAHSGWAALVVLATRGDELTVVERGRLELIESAGAEWAKQPYHAAEEMASDRARHLVRRSITMARRLATHEVRRAIARMKAAGHQVTAGAVLTAEPMPAWTVEEILAVHVRMHRAEGVLFRDALARAVRACRLRCVEIPEKRLNEVAEKALPAPVGRVREKVAALKKSIGPPWGMDQKDAALAALIALQGSGR